MRLAFVLAEVQPDEDTLYVVEIVNLPAGEQKPKMLDDEPWVIVEANGDGRFFGTGSAYKPTGESVFYISLAENDVSLAAALAAARAWAAQYGVSRIWLQETAD